MLLAELLGSTASVSLRWAGGGCSDRGLGATQKPCALQPHSPATGNPNTAQRQCPSQLPGTLKTAIRNCNEGLGKLVCFYKCNLTKSVLPSQCSSQGWLPGGFFWKAWASSEFKFAASFFQLQQTKCSLSIHTPVNPQLRQVDKSQKNKLMSPSHVSGLRVHIQQMHKGFWFFLSLKIHRHSKFLEGTPTERHVLAIATKLVRHKLLDGLPDKQHVILLPLPPSQARASDQASQRPASHFAHTWAYLSLQQHYPPGKAAEDRDVLPHVRI